MSRAHLLWPAEAIWEAVSPALPEFSVEILPEIDSTNTELMRRARAGRLEPVLLVAEAQTAGRGRLGRSWQSGPVSSAGPPQAAKAPSGLRAAAPDLPAQVGTARRGADSGGSAACKASEDTPVPSVGALPSLTFSLGLPLAPVDWSGLSLAVGVAVAESLHADIGLKWPNDLWWQERKLGGILIETASLGVQRYAVIGVGLNIAPREAAGLSTPPAWLQAIAPELDAPGALGRLAAPLVQAVQAFERFGFAPFQARFNARDVLRERPVTLSDGTRGIAQGVGETGALRVQTAQGLQEVTSAEVSVRPAGLGGA